MYETMSKLSIILLGCLLSLVAGLDDSTVNKVVELEKQLQTQQAVVDELYSQMASLKEQLAKPIWSRSLSVDNNKGYTLTLFC